MDRNYQVAVNVPPGTPIATPLAVPFPLEDAKLVGVDIVVPDGHSGTTGIQLLYAGTQIAPFRGSTWYIANNEKIPVSFNDQITASGLVIQAYNTDVFVHTFYVRALIISLPSATGGSPGVITPVSNQLLNSGTS